MASVSSFVSCKDYDDDINNLQKQIDNAALKSDLSALQTTLTSVQSTANSAATTAQQALTNAGANATDIAALKSAAAQQGNDIAAAAKAAADAAAAANAATDAADAATLASAAAVEAAAAAAKEAAEQANKDAQEKIDAAIAGFTAKFDAVNAAAQSAAALKDDVDAAKKAADDAAALAKAAKDAAAAAATQADVDAAIAKLNNVSMDDVKKAIDAAIAAAGQGQGTVDAMGWEKAITSIEFVVANGIINNPDFLNFQFGKQLDNVFGNGKELHAYAATDKPQTYKKGDDIKAENVYFVRVNPVTADLSKANLKLINSLGEDLSEFVNIEAESYKELLTRAEETGIWKVTVTLKDGADRAKLQKATNAKLSRDQKRTISSAVYALAACNTEGQDARLAVTTYDLKALTNEYAPIADLAFTVNNVAVANIYNRWNAAARQIVAEDGSIERDSLYWELAWETAANAEKYGFTVPAVKAVTNIAFDADGVAKNNYVADAADDRRAQAKLQVQPEEQIVVQFPIAQYPYVDRYYVEFDKDNAIESAPSEFESWKSYNATGLFQMKKVSERLILTVPADAATGDIVGFRLYAVNYDGTLVDPDGKAFYVQVGFVPNRDDSDILSATFTAREAALATAAGAAGAKAIIENKANGVIIPFNFLEKYSLAKGTLADPAHGFVATLNVDPTKEQNSNFVTAAGTNVNVYYLKSNKLDAKGNAQLATNVEDVKYVALNIQNPENIIDGATIETDPLQFIDVDKHNKTIGFLSFMVKKGDIVPNPTTTNQDNKIVWKSGQNGTFYPKMAATTWNALFASTADDEVFNLATYATGVDTYANLATYKWTLSKIENNTTTEADFVQPTLAFAGTTQTLAGSRTADQSTVSATAGTATAFNLTVTPTMVKYAKAVKITISDYAGVAGLSRTSLTTAPAAGDPHVYQTLTLNFSDIWDAQTYNKLTYQDGVVDKAATTLTDETQEYYVKASAPAGLRTSWTAATTGGTPLKITAAAVKNYAGATNLALAAIMPSSENSAYELFKGSHAAAKFAFAPADYVKFATEKSVSTLTADDIISFYVKSESGAKNEYITPAYGALGNINAGTAFANNTAANLATVLGAAVTFGPTTGAPVLTKTIKQTLVIKLVDAFGRTHDFSIPFELIP